MFLQVNLDFNTSHIISQSLQRPSAACFVVAQRKIFSLMENDSFPRFLQSEQYQGLFHAGSGGRGKHRKAFRTKSAEGVIERGPKTIILSWARLCTGTGFMHAGIVNCCTDTCPRTVDSRCDGASLSITPVTWRLIRPKAVTSYVEYLIKEQGKVRVEQFFFILSR